MKPYPTGYAALRRRLHADIKEFLQLYVNCQREGKPLPSVTEFINNTSLQAGVTPRTMKSLFLLLGIEVRDEVLVKVS